MPPADAPPRPRTAAEALNELLRRLAEDDDDQVRRWAKGLMKGDSETQQTEK